MARLGLSGFAGGMGATAGGSVMARMMRVEEIGVDPALSGVFKINGAVLEEVSESMKESGFDRSEPLVLWKGRGVVVDGHTRLAAAKAAGIVDAPVVEKEFEDLNEAVLYAVRRQTDRRNLTQAEIYAMATELRPKLIKDGSGRAAEKLAKLLNVSRSTVEHARVVEARAEEEVKEAVKSGGMSINQAYGTVRERKEPEKGRGNAGGGGLSGGFGGVGFDDEFGDGDDVEEGILEAGAAGDEGRRGGASKSGLTGGFGGAGFDDEFGDGDDVEEEILEADGGGGDEGRRGGASKSGLTGGFGGVGFDDEFGDGDDVEEEILEADGGGDEEGIFDAEDGGGEECADYESPRIGLDEAVVFILGKGEKRLARELVEEFAPESERAKFWGLFPPGMEPKGE
jgi:ParB family chromosome partitioning protein